MNSLASEEPSTPRFARKRDAIVVAATNIINKHGVKGMTLADVAESVGLITTSVTYYFKKKEDLAAACFMASTTRFDAMITAALEEPTPEARLRRFVKIYIDEKASIRLGEADPLVHFNDVRALTPEHLKPVSAAYSAFFRKVRRLFWDETDAAQKPSANARAHLLMEQVFWAVVWLARYEVEDYPRISDRMVDILVNGLAAPGAVWAPRLLNLSSANRGAQETFLIAATWLINLKGYRGASVEMISAELNVTKGSFYHHNQGKDDLVFACFERTFEVIRRAQTAAMTLPGNEWTRLSSVAAALVEYQLSDEGPLLRTSALSALPREMRAHVLQQSSRLSDRFSAIISDGITEGSIRPVDPVLAAQMLTSTINASAELRVWVKGVEASKAADLYIRPVLMGLVAG